MSHHLTRDQHHEVHAAHARKNGGASYRPVELQVVNPGQNFGATILVAHLYVEVCNDCGYMTNLGCNHGAMAWTHRPGCPKYNLYSLPEGLVTSYEDTDFAGSSTPDADCEGCLLLCPLCKADGT